MRARIYIIWDHLRTSFWFIPSLLGLFAWALAFLTIMLDRNAETQYEASWLFHGGPEGARAVLTTVAGSMITVAGVVFSITIVALTLASQQYGPRLLRNFVGDRANQFVLGVFIATFLYSLLIIRNVTGSSETRDQFVPVLSVTTSVALAVFNLGVLIYFIHHVALSIHASNVIARVAAELYETVDRLAEEQQNGAAPSVQEKRPSETSDSYEVRANKSGYIQSIDYEQIRQEACRNDCTVEVIVRPGDFMVYATPIALISARQQLSDKSVSNIQSSFIVGAQRTALQDLEFALDQMVEIAVRALSPGVNDPFTAVTCVDRLSEVLCYLARMDFGSPYHRDKEGNLRMICKRFTFEGAIDAAFNQIRQYGRSSAAVTIRMLEVISTIARFTKDEEARNALRRQATLIQEGSKSGLAAEWDRQEVDERFRDSMQKLSEPAKQVIES